jgi:hypothetical protein
MRGEPIDDLPQYRLVADGQSFIISVPERGDPTGEYVQGQDEVVTFGITAGEVASMQRLEGAHARLLSPQGDELALVVVEKTDADSCLVVARVERSGDAPAPHAPDA